jgi:hypothetical protein
MLMRKLQKSGNALYSNKQNINNQNINKQNNSNNLSEGNINNASNLLTNSSNINPNENPFINSELYKKDPNGFASRIN